MLTSRNLLPIPLAVALVLSGCSSLDQVVANSSQAASCVGGGLIGALAGGVIGSQTKSGKTGVIVGAVVGAAAGCGAGYLYKERVDRLQAIAKTEGLKMQVHELRPAPAANNSDNTNQSVGVEAQLEDEAMFDVGSSLLTTDGRRKLTVLAKEFASNRSTNSNPDNREKVLVIGHTDSSGTPAFNQRLSEQRARAVGQILADAGISKQDIYYQGAGSSRPVADNRTEQDRAQNRRVEFVEVDNLQVLVQRVQSERNNIRYLAHTTAEPIKNGSHGSENINESHPASAAKTEQTETTANSSLTSSQTVSSLSVNQQSNGSIDFCGVPVSNNSSALVRNITPKQSALQLIGSAYADSTLNSCVADLPRMSGDVKNLENDKKLDGVDANTNDFFPGLNGHPWLAAVNGHIVAVGPVSILKDGAQVTQQPFMQFIPNYKTTNKSSPKYQAIANTYEGETHVLYRVYAIDQNKSPVSCMDVVFDKRAGTASGGEIFYPKQGDAYVANYVPERR